MHFCFLLIKMSLLFKNLLNDRLFTLFTKYIFYIKTIGKNNIWNYFIDLFSFIYSHSSMMKTTQSTSIEGFALQDPENDPKNVFYVWVVRNSKDKNS